MFLYITENLSYQRLSDQMACKYNVVMTDTAWRKRIVNAIPCFYEAAREYANECFIQEEKEKSNVVSNTILSNYNCYAIDATNLPIEGKSSESIRIHTQYSLNSDCIVYDKISDNHSAESTEHFKIESECLYTADRAYGKSNQLVYMMEKDANFIVRFSPNHINFYEDINCKNKINFQEKISNVDFICQSCYVKYKKQIFPVRIIGAKKPLEKQEESEQKVKKKAKKNQYEVSQKTIDYSKWLFLATTLDEVPPNEIIAFYRLRWQIELFFKRSKSLLNFHKIRHSYSKHRDLLVALWFAVAYIVSSIKIKLDNDFDLGISEYNLFSFIIYLFP